MRSSKSKDVRQTFSMNRREDHLQWIPWPTLTVWTKFRYFYFWFRGYFWFQTKINICRKSLLFPLKFMDYSPLQGFTLLHSSFIYYLLIGWLFDWFSYFFIHLYICLPTYLSTCYLLEFRYSKIHITKVFNFLSFHKCIHSFNQYPKQCRPHCFISEDLYSFRAYNTVLHKYSM